MPTRRRRAKSPPLYELVVRSRPKLVEDVVAWLVENGAPGLEERPSTGGVEVVLFGEDRARLLRLSRATKRYFAKVRGIRVAVRAADRALGAWRSTWTESLTPRRLTPRLVVVPTTASAPRLSRTERAIFLEPALAFGFGEHPSTRLAARAVEEVCRTRHVPRMLDVGTGSGILAFVGVLSGAGRAIGVDTDADAVRAARVNAKRNAVTAKCRFSMTLVSRIRERFELVVANIRFSPLADAAPGIARVVASGGILVLSGVLAGECRELERRYRVFGFERLRSRARQTEEGWGLVVLRRAALRSRLGGG